MIAFDTDVLTEILQGNDAFVIRAAVIPIHEQAARRHTAVHFYVGKGRSPFAFLTDCRFADEDRPEIAFH